MGERMAERFLPIYLMALGGGALATGTLGFALWGKMPKELVHANAK